MQTSINSVEKLHTLSDLVEFLNGSLDEDTKYTLDVIGGLEALLNNACENAFDMGYEEGFQDAKQITSEDLN